MNSLSWFIYGVYLVNATNITIAFVLGVLFIVGMLKLFGVTQIQQYKKINESGGDYSSNYGYVTVGDRISASIKSLVIWRSILAVVDIFIPSKQTMILIAASEVGEKLADNQKVGQIIDPSLDLLKTWIEKEKNDLLKSMKPEEEKKVEEKK